MAMKNLNKFWQVKDNGFLPNEYSAFDSLLNSFYRTFVSGMPYFSRQEVLNYFNDRSLDINNELNDIQNSEDIDGAESMMRLLSYAASFYIHHPEEPVVNILPKAIAAPFVRVSNMVGRLPILSYASYCLFNWVPDEYGDLRTSLLQNFCKSDAKRDEDWFILIHVDIEQKAAKGIKSIANFNLNYNIDEAKAELQTMLESLVLMNVALKRMPEQCSPEVYYLKVRPYIFSFENIVYEGEFNNIPQTFRGETGAQSSIVPAFQIALGVQHQESLLTTHLKDMRNYMPLAHREFLTNLEQKPTIRDFAITNINDSGLKNLYNACVGQLYEFRKQHLYYAVDYIQRKVPNPKGTGGTPFIPWLSKLAEETESYYL